MSFVDTLAVLVLAAVVIFGGLAIKIAALGEWEEVGEWWRRERERLRRRR